MSQLGDTKDRIQTLLEELVPNDLGMVISDALIQPYWKRNIGKGNYPVAIIETPSIESEMSTNRDNIRTFTYNVAVIMRTAEVTSDKDVENLMEAIMDKIDQDPTLNNTAQAGVQPTVYPAEPDTDPSGDIIRFVVQISAGINASLSF